MNDSVFTKVLISIHDPKNACFAPDGDVLTVIPRKSVPIRGVVPHFFVSTRNHTCKSRIGWVEEREPFTLGDFIYRHYGSKDLTASERDHVRVMLEAVERVSPSEPVIVEYARRDIPSRMELSVHKVFLYTPKSKR
jgi:hypothetical protein